MDYLRRSIRTLNQVVENPEIVICFTPPVDQADIESLAEYDPYIRDNVPARVWGDKVTDSKIMNKVHVGEVQGDIVVMPDVNIIFRDDPTPLTEGEFDIAGRVLKDKTYGFWFISCRYLIFKNNTQEALAAKWLEEYNDEERGGNIESVLYDVAVDLGLNIKNIDKEMDAYVLHIHGRFPI